MPYFGIYLYHFGDLDQKRRTAYDKDNREDEPSCAE